MAISRWIAPATLAVALAAGSLAPAPAQAQSYDLSRAIVDIANVVFRGNQPYYRNSNYGSEDRLVRGRDAYGRTVYYRVDQNGRAYDQNGRYLGQTGGYDDRYNSQYRTRAQPYGNAYGYHRNQQSQQRQVRCNQNGKCRTEYYDPRYDRRGYGRYGDDRRWDGDDD